MSVYASVLVRYHHCCSAMLLSHFNESFLRADCGMKCDNCVADKAAASVDITLPVGE